MKNRIVYVLGLMALLWLTFSGCDEDPNTLATIMGLVTDSVTFEPINGALVSLLSPYNENSVSDATGHYIVEFRVKAGETGTVKIMASKVGYKGDTVDVYFEGGKTTNAANLILFNRNPIDTTDTTKVDTCVSGPPAKIAMVGISSDTIFVANSGRTEASTITFEVRDATGKRICKNKRASVWFKIEGGIGGGEFLFPAADSTNDSGQVKVTLNSGTRSGNVQIVAYAKDFESALSEVVPIIIHGGAPHRDHFSLAVQRLNIPGRVYSGLSDTISAYLSDIYGNPVPPGTAVYFSTNSGYVTAQAFTNELGECFSLLKSSPPHSDNGIARVVAETVDGDGKRIQAEANVLFSGPTMPIEVHPPTFELTNGDPPMLIVFYVRDDKGNPISPGSTVKVTATNATANGDIDVTIPDTKNKEQWTEFNVILTDFWYDAANPQSGNITVVIDVESENGNARAFAYGIVKPKDETEPDTTGNNNNNDDPKSNLIYTLVLADADPDSLSVIEAGGMTASRVTFFVFDDLGRPLDNRYLNTTTINFEARGPASANNGGVVVVPSSANPYNDGDTTKVFVMIHSGYRAGTYQVYASSTSNPQRFVVSRPVTITVEGGLPDANHFSVAPSLLNIAGRKYLGLIDTITAYVGDYWGNAVRTGTSVYFTTDNGYIDGNDTTDDMGRSSVALISAAPIDPLPFPSTDEILEDISEPGTIYPSDSAWAWITAQTQVQPRNEDGSPLGTNATELDSTAVLFSAHTRIILYCDNGGLSYFNIPNGGWDNCVLVICDTYGNPIVGGSTVAIQAKDAELIGPTSITVADTRNRGWGTTWFNIALADDDPDTVYAPPKFTTLTIDVQSLNGNVSQIVAGSLQ